MVEGISAVIANDDPVPVWDLEGGVIVQVEGVSISVVSSQYQLECSPL